ncbi:SLATT domain-containing protein [Pedobacter sp. UBA5917]|uniref:SLATT domain-containing protein n=1 Tax=Pedobacter sp. UBA5917 TaxID=1947061 RepID=UPI0025D29123|nr:SLATT domain-containing protein [Pedobacter sp. UBA5917]
MKYSNINDPFYQQIQNEINRVEGKANTYIGFFYFIRITQILLAGLITVISGLKKPLYFGEDTILILGAILTAITSIDTLFQVDTKKNTYKLLLFDFRSIRAEFVSEYLQNNGVVSNEFKAGLFKKYERANAYARDLIISDKKPDPAGGKEPSPAS